MIRPLFLFLSFLTSSVASAAGEVTAQIAGSQLQVGLAATETYVAFQMDITAPLSATFGTPIATDRLHEGPPMTLEGTTRRMPFQLHTNLVATDETRGTQTLRLLVYNLGLYPILDGEGPLFTLDLGTADLGEVTIDGIRFVEDYTYDEVAFSPLTLGTLTADLPSGLTAGPSSATSSSHTFGLDGRATAPAAPGSAVILRQSPDGTVRKQLHTN